MSKALQLTGGPEVAETAHFVDFMDKFFDSLNVSNYTHGIHKRKAFQLPYLSAKDKRLEVCLNVRRTLFTYSSLYMHYLHVSRSMYYCTCTMYYCAVVGKRLSALP